MYKIISYPNKITLLIVIAFLSACGGGGGGDSLPNLPPPAKPDESKITTLGADGAVTINWQALPSLSYNVYRSTDNGASIETQVTSNFTGSSFTDTSSDNDVEYTYLISAVSSGKESIKAVSPSVIPYARVLKISAGEHSCLIKNDGAVAGRGSLWCWGDNTFGELGIGVVSYSEEPQQVLLAESNPDKVKNDWISVSAGGVHTCAIKGTGTLYCWGLNNNRQLGLDVSVTKSVIPVQIGITENIPRGWTKVVVGDFHTCGLREKGVDSNALYCWGENTFGQTGNGKSGLNELQTGPFQVAASINWVDIALGGKHSCGIQKDPGTGKSTAWCWGQGVKGQVGNNTLARATSLPVEVLLPSPTELNLVGWTKIATGKNNSCAIRTVGTAGNFKDTIWCWGYNKYGQLGIGDIAVVNQATPRQEASSAIDWLDVKSYSDTVCAQKQTKEIYCWGSNVTGQVGNGTSSDTPVLESVTAIVSEGVEYKDWVLFDVGDNHACGLKPDNKIYCWGSRSKTTLGKTSSDSNKPVRINTDINWIALSTGAQSEFVIGLKNTGEIQSWGRNFDGQLGTADGQKNNTKKPMPLATKNNAGDPTNWKQISSGSKSVLSTDFSTTAMSCAIAVSDDTLWCWGANIIGFTNSTVPLQVNNVDTWLDVAVGTYHVCAIKKVDNSLWCIGSNSYGELGDNKINIRESNFVAVTVPAAVTNGWSSVSAGHYYNCAISNAEQQLYCWGLNSSGQVGDGSKIDKFIPTLVKAEVGAIAVNKWSTINVGLSHTCGIKTNNELNCWGNNKFNELGRLKISNTIPLPVDMPTATSWLSVAVGRFYSCAIKSISSTTEGELYCWGRNEDGKLGLGKFISPNVTVPTQVGSDSNWKVIATGKMHTCGIKYDAELTGDSVWCWGLNRYGSLGTDNAWATTPVYLSIP